MTRALDDAIAEVIGPGDIATGMTVLASTSERSIERFAGTRYDGVPVAPTDISPLYFATTPILSLLVLQLIEEGRLAVDMPIDQSLPWLSGHWLGRITVGQLLRQETTLHRVGVFVPMMVEASARGVVLQALPPDGPDDVVGHSDFGPGYLLACAVQEVCGKDFRQLARERVVERYGISLRDLNLGIPDDRIEEWAPDISVSLYSSVATGLYPFVTEACSVWACEWNPPFSSYGTAAGLLRFYEGLLGDLGGAGVAIGAQTLQDAVEPGPVRPDINLQRDVSFGSGFMTNMALFALADGPSPRSFGHIGLGGGAIGFADPEHGLSAVILINAIFDESRELLERRAEVLKAIYEELT